MKAWRYRNNGRTKQYSGHVRVVVPDVPVYSGVTVTWVISRGPSVANTLARLGRHLTTTASQQRYDGIKSYYNLL